MIGFGFTKSTLFNKADSFLHDGLVLTRKAILLVSLCFARLARGYQIQCSLPQINLL